MKTLNKIFLVLLIGVGWNTLSAQSEEDPISENLNSFSDRASALNYLSSHSGGASTNNSNGGSTVYIDQIGEGNVINTNLAANQSEMNFFQNGNWNNIFLNVSADKIENNVMQNGERNSFLNVGHDFSGSQQLDIIQNGDNQDVTIYGGNSLSEKLKISMQGDNKSIIVRNF